MSFIGIRLALDYRAALIPNMLEVINEIYEKNKASITKNDTVSYTHLRAHETVLDLVCRLLLEKKKQKTPRQQ